MTQAWHYVAFKAGGRRSVAGGDRGEAGEVTSSWRPGCHITCSLMITNGLLLCFSLVFRPLSIPMFAFALQLLP